MQLLALTASALALAGSAVAQESARFGGVSVYPTTVKVGETFTVHYNSTTAVHQPKYYDAYIQGTDANGFIQPPYLLQRTVFPTDGTKNVYFNTTVPPIGLGQNVSHLIWAYVTYPVDNTPDAPLEYAGVSTGIYVDVPY
ncbi:hypothetical protein PsYK624_094530 [Phanerochaete sordida]|uniref:Uncharacterized protein n=1 Tax=Phanerochaete sordida TaxID=48140 RepID=A0A9P3LG50_9APHY|nr:hypothetical protein PsYK624_094530 [Phanerochaete sordida]